MLSASQSWPAEHQLGTYRFEHRGKRDLPPRTRPSPNTRKRRPVRTTGLPLLEDTDSHWGAGILIIIGGIWVSVATVTSRYGSRGPETLAPARASRRSQFVLYETKETRYKEHKRHQNGTKLLIFLI